MSEFTIIEFFSLFLSGFLGIMLWELIHGRLIPFKKFELIESSKGNFSYDQRKYIITTFLGIQIKKEQVIE